MTRGALTAGPSPPDTPREHTKSSAILDPYKNRYMSDSSAVAFPRLLGIELSSSNAPRLHSFAWNLGVRAEPRVDQLDFTTYLTFTESERLIEVYFKTVHPVYDFIDRESFTELWRSRYLMRNEKRDIDAVICGVAALGKHLLLCLRLPFVCQQTCRHLVASQKLAMRALA